MVYQEQVMLIAQKVAGFSLAKADLLRRAMGKKIKSEMQAQRSNFLDGCLKNKLDEKNWVYDFGNFSFLENWLRDHFDHTLLVAMNDPYIDEIKSLEKNKIAKIVGVPGISCERFAEMTFKFLDNHFKLNDYNVKVLSVEVSEHPGNTAGYYGE